MLKPGHSLTCQRGCYTIASKLAEGGMGIIHLARGASGDMVVVKEPKITGSAEDQLHIQKLTVETAILKNLDHQHIMKYIDSSVEGGVPYLVVEYIDGKTWDKTFTNNPLPEDKVDQHVLEVLDAVAYMHDRNVIHRDIKAANVVESSKGEDKLIDFGAAKYFYTQMAQSQQTQIYTPGWAAPEQFWGGATYQSDIYGVGASLFFMLTGKPPGLYMDMSGQIKPPSQVNSSVRRMSKVVVRAMDIDPNKRYQTATDMKNDILGILSATAEPHIILGSTKHVIPGELTVGRAVDCDVPISDPAKFVSKHHARIYQRGGQFFIDDMGSLNGTFVGQDLSRLQKIAPTSPRALDDNDIIALCYHSNLGPYITLKFKTGGR